MKIRTVKRNICKANGKWNTELSRVASVRFRRDKNSGEGWEGGEWKAPNPEANEKQEPAGLGGAEKIQAGPRDKFKVTCRRPSLHSFPTGWPLQQIPCHILCTSLLHRLLPTNHSLQQFACQGFQFPFPLRLLLLSLLMCGLGQYSCIFPSHFLPLLVASSHNACPGMLCLPHDPSRFRCFLSNWEYYQKKTRETLLCKVILVSNSQRSSLFFWFIFFFCAATGYSCLWKSLTWFLSVLSEDTFIGFQPSYVILPSSG